MDCQEKSETVFHIMGLKCMAEDCGSYNTVRCGEEEIPADAVPVRAQEFMEYLRQRQQQEEQEEEEDNGHQGHASEEEGGQATERQILEEEAHGQASEGEGQQISDQNEQTVTS